MNYKLSPSDFSFLYEECKRCFYLKVVHGIPRPSTPMPSIFTKITNLLKDYYSNKSTKDLHPMLPPGVVKYGEKYVRSKIIELPNHNITCYINGRFDIVVEFKDKTYGIIDFKTGNPSEKYKGLYSRQLHAYAYALEHAAPNARLKLYPITTIGLLYFSPSKIQQQNIGQILYESDIEWVEINKNDQGFLDFVNNVLYTLSSTTVPEASPDCQWCKYTTRLETPLLSSEAMASAASL